MGRLEKMRKALKLCKVRPSPGQVSLSNELVCRTTVVSAEAVWRLRMAGSVWRTLPETQCKPALAVDPGSALVAKRRQNGLTAQAVSLGGCGRWQPGMAS